MTVQPVRGQQQTDFPPAARAAISALAEPSPVGPPPYRRETCHADVASVAFRLRRAGDGLPQRIRRQPVALRQVRLPLAERMAATFPAACRAAYIIVAVDIHHRRGRYGGCGWHHRNRCRGTCRYHWFVMQESLENWSRNAR